MGITLGPVPHCHRGWRHTGRQALEAETSLESLREMKRNQTEERKGDGRLSPQPLCRSPRIGWGPAESRGPGRLGGWEAGRLGGPGGWEGPVV